MSADAWVGIGPGNLMYQPITSSAVSTPAGLVPATDLTLCTAVSFTVFRPDQPTTPVTWSGVIVSATPIINGVSTLMATHAFAVPDCPVDGRYEIVPVLTFAGGTTDGTTVPLIVKLTSSP